MVQQNDVQMVEGDLPPMSENEGEEVKIKAPRTSKDWAILWVKLNRWEIFPCRANHSLAIGAMKLCEMFCTKKEIDREWMKATK